MIVSMCVSCVSGTTICSKRFEMRKMSQGKMNWYGTKHVLELILCIFTRQEYNIYLLSVEIFSDVFR